MEKFFNCCILFGYETQNPNFWVNVFIIEVILAVVCGCAAMALVNVIVLRLIKNRAKLLTKKTLKLHIMLYKALTTQMVIIVFCIFMISCQCSKNSNNAILAGWCFAISHSYWSSLHLCSPRNQIYKPSCHCMSNVCQLTCIGGIYWCHIFY